MSRIGKKPIPITKAVQANLQDNLLTVKGPLGELTGKIPPELQLEFEEDAILVKPVNDSQRSRELWGLWRTLIANMVQGVTEGFSKRLQMEGVGYRVALDSNSLVLNVGYTHPVTFIPPAGVQFAVERNTITVSGVDKQEVGEWASRIRASRPPEPYKGKGIRYEGEVIRRKEGKKAAT